MKLSFFKFLPPYLSGKCCTSARCILATLTALFVCQEIRIHVATISPQHNMVSLVNKKLFPDRISSISQRQRSLFLSQMLTSNSFSSNHARHRSHLHFPPQKPYLLCIAGDIPVFCRFFLPFKSATHHFHDHKFLHLIIGCSTHVVRGGRLLNWQVTWRESLTWRSVLCVTSRQTLFQPFRRVSLQTLLSPRRGRIGDNPAPVVSLQGSSPTSWSLSLMSGTVSRSPVCSAGPWWVTCTRTRPAGAACATHTPLEKKTGRTSLNSPLVLFFCDPVNRRFYPCLSSQALKVRVPDGFHSGAIAPSAGGDEWSPAGKHERL